MREAGIRHGRVVDLGCGSGVWAATLMDNGHSVLGVDTSAAMIALARRNAPGARFVRGSLWSVHLPPCDAITSIGECLNYAFDGVHGTKEMAALFRSALRALRPGGLFVFDVLGPAGDHVPPVRRHFTEGASWTCLVKVTSTRRMLTRHITTFTRHHNAYRRSMETHVQHLHNPDTLLRLLRNTGFAARRFRSYGTMPPRTGHAVFLARKPRIRQ